MVVVPNALVDKVHIIAKTGSSSSVDAVEFRLSDPTTRQEVTYTAQLVSNGEVALTSGALGNVAILQRSGVGPRDVLTKLGIPVHGDNYMVGKGVDHPEISILWEWIFSDENSLPRGGVNGWPLVLFDAGTDPKTGEKVDFMAHFGAGFAEPYTAFPSVVASPNVMRPSLESDGGYRAVITSTNPRDSMTLWHNEQAKDYHSMALAIQQIEKVFAKA